MKGAKRALQRRAIVLDLGGFRPPEDPRVSWFGRVNLAAPGETWPESAGKPMLALAQINLAALPFRPPRLDDLAFITVFVDAEQLPNDDANGTRWCLRGYPSLEGLVPLPRPVVKFPIKPLPMKPRLVEPDYPCPEDLPDDVELELDTIDGFKLGGWPSLIQSEIFWAPHNAHPAAPEYVFQIDSTEKGQWSWGDGGVGYFGRGTAPGRENEWTCAWQSY